MDTDRGPLHFRRSHLAGILASMDGQAQDRRPRAPLVPVAVAKPAPVPVLNLATGRKELQRKLEALRAAVVQWWAKELPNVAQHELQLLWVDVAALPFLRKPFAAEGATLKVLKGRPAAHFEPAEPAKLQVNVDLQGTGAQFILYSLDSFAVLLKDLQVTHAAKPYGLASIRNGSAPARAVGNFSTEADRERTLQALRDNLATARESGHEPLIDVMAKALATAMARPVDPRY
jgi:hypothetical protein